MADCIVFASGSGSNFEAIAEYLSKTPHMVSALISDRQDAMVLQRAQRLRIPAYFIPYDRSRRTLFEETASGLVLGARADLIILAGFMRILTSPFVDRFKNRIVNIHPSLLPRYPGAHAIEQSFSSGDTELGITIHYVDHGLDSGPIIARRSFNRHGNESLTEIEGRIHALEHLFYPEIVRSLLDEIDAERSLARTAMAR